MIRSVAQWTRKWQAGMSGADQTARESVNAMTESPAVAAVAAQSRMRAAWLQSIDSGRWAEAMQGTTLEKFKTAMLMKGIPNMTAAASRQDVVARQAAYARAAHAEYQALQDAARREKADGVSGEQRLTNNLARMKALRGRFRQR